jgi:hypothetical protein
MTDDDVRAEMLAALKKAREFIVNGVEFGYIRLPDRGDTALDTLPAIEAAIEKAEAPDWDELLSPELGESGG